MNLKLLFAVKVIQSNIITFVCNKDTIPVCQNISIISGKSCRKFHMKFKTVRNFFIHDC